MNNCNLCPNACGVDRTTTAGVCGSDDKIMIAKYYPHMYEEPVISGSHGSGAIFFCGCSLKCVFCQNYEVSRGMRGRAFTARELADIFKRLEKSGVHNINLVNPTHYVDKIIDALNIYRPKIPIVYNSHGYERAETVSMLAPYIDIYLPDVKFFSAITSFRYTGKSNYFAVAARAVELMTEQKPVIITKGIMQSGTVVRHLMLPQNVADTLKILDWFATIKDKAYLSLMSQYTPFGDIGNYPELQRKLTAREYSKALDYALALGIENLYEQKLDSSDASYIPHWDY